MNVLDEQKITSKCMWHKRATVSKHSRTNMHKKTSECTRWKRQTWAKNHISRKQAYNEAIFMNEWIVALVRTREFFFLVHGVSRRRSSMKVKTSHEIQIHYLTCCVKMCGALSHTHSAQRKTMEYRICVWEKRPDNIFIVICHVGIHKIFRSASLRGKTCDDAVRMLQITIYYNLSQTYIQIYYITLLFAVVAPQTHYTDTNGCTER